MLLQSITAGATISGLQGMGGIGKTELVLVVANQLVGKYPDAQFLIELRGTGRSDDPDPLKRPLTAAQALAHVIQSIEPGAKLPEDEASLRAAYLSLLHGKKATIFADNAGNADQVTPLLPPEGSLLLVTSRQYFAVGSLMPVHLDLLPEDQAIKLVKETCPRASEHATAIARQCGRLPLALRLAVGTVNARPTLGVQDYLCRLADTKQRLRALDQYRDQTGEQLGITAALQASLDLLSDELKRLWTMLAVFSGDFDNAGAAAVWGMEASDQAGDRLGDLHQYSLVDYDPKLQRWILHDLARDFGLLHLAACADQHARSAERHAGHYAAVLRTADSLYLRGGSDVLAGLTLFDVERHNIEAGQAWAAKTAEVDDVAARLASEYAQAGVYVLSVRLHAWQWVQGLQVALTAAHRLNDRGAEASHLGNLGLAYAHLGESRKAIEFHWESLATARQIGDRRREGTALGNLGTAYADLGRFSEAVEFHEQSLSIAREIGDRRAAGAALGSLGLAYSALGMPEKAIQLCQEHLAIAREMGNRRGEGNALGNLGMAFRAMGEFRRARELCQQHLAIARTVGDRYGEGKALGNLGITCAGMGRYRQAASFFRKQLAVAQQVRDRRGMGNALFNLALAMELLGERQIAIALAEQALKVFYQIENPNAAMIEQTLAQWRQGEAVKVPPGEPG